VTATRSTDFVVRRLGAPDRAELIRLVDEDPYVNVVLAERLRGNCADLALGGDLIGIDGPSGLAAACFRGGAVLPIGGDEASWLQLAAHLSEARRNCSSIVGRADAVHAMWSVLAGRWAPARLVRSAQPLLVLDHPSDVISDPLVRPARAEEIDRYVPAAEAMFAEELELGPPSGASRRSYRLRLAALIAARRVFLRLDSQGRVTFKAEIGAVSATTCQIQGVWVRPDLRGLGLGTSAVAAVIDYALRIAPTASLYVNDFNHAARRVYDRLGMQQVATVATILF
jgi:predicted GNAT family acetyltransferase